jgi:prepilin-type N-terminal cleavage/methylation domain-containing protein
MRRGVVLTELLIVLVLMGIVASIAAPRLGAIADAAAVRDEALRVVAAIDAARGAAVRLNVDASLTLASGSYDVEATVPPDTVLAWHQQGPAENGVTLGGAGQPLAFGPSGLAMGVSNRTITLSKGNALRKVVVSKLGRVTY